jgi:hypothetical protein
MLELHWQGGVSRGPTVEPVPKELPLTQLQSQLPPSSPFLFAVPYDRRPWSVSNVKFRHRDFLTIALHIDKSKADKRVGALPLFCPFHSFNVLGECSMCLVRYGVPPLLLLQQPPAVYFIGVYVPVFLKQGS